MDANEIQGAIPLISWDKIIRPKCESGLDIRRVQDLNTALLAKLGWKVLNDPDNYRLELCRQST